MNRLLVLLIGLISIADAFAIESPDTILSSSRFSPILILLKMHGGG